MKKAILFSLSGVFLFFLILLIAAVVISFRVVKKDTDKINAGLKKELTKIVRIPDVVGPNFKSFDKVSYKWDMVTNQNEVVPVEFSHDTGIPSGQDKIITTLELSQGGDPSVFEKVLPAVISDQQALISAQNLEHANLGSNEQIGYNKIEMFKSDEKPDKIAKIVWEFNRNDLIKNSKNYYDELYQYPEYLLKVLYTLQQSIVLSLK